MIGRSHFYDSRCADRATRSGSFSHSRVRTHQRLYRVRSGVDHELPRLPTEILGRSTFLECPTVFCNFRYYRHADRQVLYVSGSSVSLCSHRRSLLNHFRDRNKPHPEKTRTLVVWMESIWYHRASVRPDMDCRGSRLAPRFSKRGKSLLQSLSVGSRFPSQLDRKYSSHRHPTRQFALLLPTSCAHEELLLLVCSLRGCC